MAPAAQDPGDPVRLDIDDEAIACLSFDAVGSQNLLDGRCIASLDALLDRIAATPGLCGVIVVSRKKDFIAGGDLDAIMAERDAGRTFETTFRLSSLLRRIERASIPFVAAVNGTALGGGFELALACHRRVVADRPGLLLGLPEARVGLMPGAGGTQRLPRMIGVRRALPLLTTGATLSPAEALALGLIDEVVAPDALIAQARSAVAGLAAAGRFAKAWDSPGFELPGGEVQSPGLRRFFMDANAQANARTQGNSPAERCILAAVYQGCQSGLDAALRIEARKFAEVAATPQARAIIRTGFFGKRVLRKAAAGSERPRVATVGVVGLGLMGAGIAAAAAMRGYRVVMLDRDAAATGAGHARALAVVRKSAARSSAGGAANATGAADAADAAGVAAIGGRLTVAAAPADLAVCDLVIEAVPEDRSLKLRILAELERSLGPDTVIASNTSSIPISRLAGALTRPARFVGMHFFSPVERMELIEIVPGEQTDRSTRALALELARGLGKTPIVARDVRGFYTGRVFAPYLAESFAMVAEGWAPALIENGARRLGMPIGPLALADAVSIELQQRLRRQEEADGDPTRRLPAADRVVDVFVDELDRRGRAAGAGFYDYPADGKRLWSGYRDRFGRADPQPGVDAVVGRLLMIQVLDALRCLEDGVVASPLDVDVGAVLGWGFPLHLGGPCCWADERGAAAVVAAARVLAARHGERFEPPPGLLRRAAEGRRYHPA